MNPKLPNQPTQKELPEAILANHQVALSKITTSLREALATLSHQPTTDTTTTSTETTTPVEAIQSTTSTETTTPVEAILNDPIHRAINTTNILIRELKAISEIRLGRIAQAISLLDELQQMTVNQTTSHRYKQTLVLTRALDISLHAGDDPTKKAKLDKLMEEMRKTSGSQTEPAPKPAHNPAPARKPEPAKKPRETRPPQPRKPVKRPPTATEQRTEEQPPKDQCPYEIAQKLIGKTNLPIVNQVLQKITTEREENEPGVPMADMLDQFPRLRDSIPAINKHLSEHGICLQIEEHDEYEFLSIKKASQE